MRLAVRLQSLRHARSVGAAHTYKGDEFVIAKSLVSFATAAAVLTLTVSTAAARQTASVPGDMVTVTAKVEAIEMQSRTLTLKKAYGTYTTLVAPVEFERFKNVKVGDTVTARYYDNVVFRKLNPGEKPADSATGGLSAPKGSKPNVTMSAQRTLTTTITAIDEKIPSITLTGPNGWVYSSKVKDRAKLKTVKVGDQVDVTWTEAVSITVTAPK